MTPLALSYDALRARRLVYLVYLTCFLGLLVSVRKPHLTLFYMPSSGGKLKLTNQSDFPFGEARSNKLL